MEKQKCPKCSAGNHPKRVANDIREFRCSKCGMVYYAPEGCRTSPRDAHPEFWARRSDGMTLPSESI